MKKCRCCGVEIVNGVNGCQLTGDICFPCRGGAPDYSKLPPSTLNTFMVTEDDLNSLEGRCLDMGEPID